MFSKFIITMVAKSTKRTIGNVNKYTVTPTKSPISEDTKFVPSTITEGIGGISGNNPSINFSAIKNAPKNNSTITVYLLLLLHDIFGKVQTS